MDTQHYYTNAITDSSGCMDELDIRSKGDRGGNVYTVIEFGRELDALHWCRHDAEKGYRLQVIKKLALRDLVVDPDEANGDAEIIVGPSGQRASPEKT